MGFPTAHALHGDAMSRRHALPLLTLSAVAAAPALPAAGAIARADRVLLDAVVRARPMWSRRAAQLVTEAAAPLVVSSAVVSAGLWALRHPGRQRAVAQTVAAAASGLAARRALAEVVRRARPPEAWWWAQPSGFSYPSRHVTWALLGFGATADLLAEAGATRIARPVRVVPVTVVAATRLLLAVHWPTDVVAAAVFSQAWRALTVGSASRSQMAD
jgi:undecaprenyl-diphosphatase